MDCSVRGALAHHILRIARWRDMGPGGWRLMEPRYHHQRSLMQQPNEVETKIPWTKHLLCVCSYVLKLNFSSYSGLLSDAKSCFLELIRCSQEPDGGTNVPVKLFSFTEQKLEAFFVVPKLHQLPDEDKALGKHEVVSAFISLLLHLLHYKPDDLVAVQFEDLIDSLQKELRFLLTVLGDTPLLVTEDENIEELQNLSAQLEMVANEAGAFVHSFIFTRDLALEATRVDETLAALLEHIDELRGNIMKFLNLQSCVMIRNYYRTPKTASLVDSLFIVDSVISDLKDLMGGNNHLIVDVKGQITILHEEWLELSQSLLKDVSVPPYSEIQELKEHVKIIRDAAYETEYLINSFLVGDASLWYLTIRLPDVIRKIKHFGTRIGEIKKSYDPGASKLAKDRSTQLPSQANRRFEVDDIIVGLEEKTTHILDQLVGGTERQRIVCIFGMPGLGKTTLAKKLYNHSLVKYRFDKLSWCVVSHKYQRRSPLVSILISLPTELNEAEILNLEEEELAMHIYQGLKGRRYLIVMDDIWSSTVWDDLRFFFPDDGNRSSILFTSRNKDVAPINRIVHELPALSNDQCWELLQKKVFLDEICPPQLVGIGKQIAANCHGLPLAVVVVAGILSTMDREESTWKNVEGSLASYIFSDENSSVMHTWDLSYKHLPDHLKPCFLYFGLFPEDKEIRVGMLVKLWVAEGFIRKEEQRSLEFVAEEYLLELINKSLVMVAKRRSDGGVKACLVHDLLRDLCLKRAEEENFFKLVGNYPEYGEVEAPSSRRVRFDEHCGSSSANNLHSLSWVVIRNLKDEEKLKYLSHLRKLKCRCEPFVAQEGEPHRHLDLRFLTQLKSLHMFRLLGRDDVALEISLPSSIKKLTLGGLRLPWEKMSIIGTLPNLEVLKLERDAFLGERWETTDDEFQQLRFLKLEQLKLVQWDVSSCKHFPKLQRLVLAWCIALQEIPGEMSEIESLESIDVFQCQESVAVSAIRIQEEQRDMGNEGHVARIRNTDSLNHMFRLYRYLHGDQI